MIENVDASNKHPYLTADIPGCGGSIKESPYRFSGRGNSLLSPLRIWRTLLRDH